MAESANDVQIYRSADGEISLEVRTDGDTVWLNRAQLAALFGRDVKTIGKHVANARREELAGLSTVAKFATVQQEGPRLVEREVEHYNLDMILSVGYRVKSAEGVHFRRWATGVLKQYLIKGAAINEDRLRQIGEIVQILGRASDEIVSGIADVLSDYLPGLTMLRDYDEGAIEVGPGANPQWTLTIDEARDVISRAAGQFPSDRLFGTERGDALHGVIATIYQGFAGQELYPTVELKAANLLYLVVKDHPLADGNKRSGAALFVTFLAKNRALVGADRRPRIANNTLAAITLMIAMSDPREKELMIALLTRMLSAEAQ